VTALFIRNENFRQFTHYYPVVSILLTVNTALFILTYLPFVGDLIYALGIGHNAAIKQGQIWRLFTSIFLHEGLMHFLFNTFALFIFAPALERILGRLKFIALYLFAGVVGNIATLLLGHDIIAYLGASGSLYGLLGLYLYMVLFRKDLIDPASGQVVTVMLVIGLVYTILWPNINLYAHLFGFLGGLALGPLYFKGQMKYFTLTPSARTESERDPFEIRFDPNRWQKKRQWKHWLKYGLIGLFILLVVIGLLTSI
jgi:membrane associated rhomboid family serine protease